MSERKGDSHHLWQNTAQKDDSNISTRHKTHAHTHTHKEKSAVIDLDTLWLCSYGCICVHVCQLKQVQEELQIHRENNRKLNWEVNIVQNQFSTQYTKWIGVPEFNVWEFVYRMDRSTLKKMAVYVPLIICSTRFRKSLSILSWQENIPESQLLQSMYGLQLRWLVDKEQRTWLVKWRQRLGNVRKLNSMNRVSARLFRTRRKSWRTRYTWKYRQGESSRSFSLSSLIASDSSKIS